MVEDGSITSAVTGNNGQYVLGQAIGGGLKETADWMKQHYGQMFDAVYVPPGHKVAVHLTEPLAIDYEPEGRQVKYQQVSTPGDWNEIYHPYTSAVTGRVQHLAGGTDAGRP